MDLAVHSLTVNPSPASINSSDQVAAALIVSDLLRIDNWLLFLRTGPLGRSDGSGVSVESGEPAFGVYGPYWSLPAGKYEMTARLENNHDAAAPKHVIKADVVVPGRYVAVGSFHINELPYDEKSGTSLLRLPFELHAQAPEERQIETRIWSSGEQRFRIRSLLVKPLERQKQDLIFPSLLIGDLGNRLGGEIRNFNQQIGFVDYGQIVLLLTRRLSVDACGYDSTGPAAGRADVVDGGSEARKQYSCGHLNFTQRSSERNSPDGI